MTDIRTYGLHNEHGHVTSRATAPEIEKWGEHSPTHCRVEYDSDRDEYILYRFCYGSGRLEPMETWSRV